MKDMYYIKVIFIICLFLLLLIFHYKGIDIYNNYYNEIIISKINNTNIYPEIKYFPPFKDSDLVLPSIIEFNVIMNISIHYHPKVVISILSSPHNFKKRYSFRYNSKKYCNIKNNCKIIFFIGYSNYEMVYLIDKELKLYNDVVQFSFQNSYLNLTLLSIMALKYCYKYFKTIEFYIKTDDDMFINYKLLFNLLKTINPNNNTVYGHVDGKFKVNRNNKTKGYIPYFEYPYEYIPKYVYGGLIIATKNSLKLIYNQTLYRQNYIWKEDVNLGMLCSLSGNNIIQFPRNIDLKLRSNICMIINNVIATEIKSYKDSFYCIK